MMAMLYANLPEGSAEQLMDELLASGCQEHTPSVALDRSWAEAATPSNGWTASSRAC